MVIDSWGTYNEELYCLPWEESAGTTICYREDWVLLGAFGQCAVCWADRIYILCLVYTGYMSSVCRPVISLRVVGGNYFGHWWPLVVGLQGRYLQGR